MIKILIESRRIKSLRVLTLGILEEHRGVGADMLLIHTLGVNAAAGGYVDSELSWILEDNGPMRAILDAIEAKVYKTYRVYDYSLSS